MEGKKLKMSQIWAGERVRPITEVLLAKGKDASVFAAGDEIKVIGRSKGKGFTGVVKRHHFRGGPATHGQSDRQRAPGAIGSTTTPGRVLKGKKMAGRKGFSRVTIRTIVLEVDRDKDILRLLGGLPGAYGAPLVLEKI